MMPSPDASNHNVQGAAMSTPNRPPLWRVIDDAWWSLVNTGDLHAAPPESDQAACVIRAVRDWILAELATGSEDEGWGPSNLIELPDLEALLTAEADRAERGDP